MINVRCFLRNTSLLVRTALQHAQDDPAHLLVQGSRRLPSSMSRVFRGVLGAAPVAGLRALSAYASGDRPRARQLAGSALATGRRGLAQRVAAEVAVEVGAVSLDLSTLPAATRARAAWKNGQMSEAMRVLDADAGQHRRLAGRLASEAQTMSPSFGLRAPAHEGFTGSGGAEGGGPRAFHVLTSSLPYTQSGYTLRTQRLLRALTEHEVEVQAVTRLGYPAMIGIPQGRDDQTIDGVHYRRILLSRLDHGLAARLQQQVDIMATMVAEFRPTVLHCTTNYTNALMTDALARGFGLPWVYEVRGLLEETWAAGRVDDQARSEARQSERFHALRAQETRMMHQADRVITLSEVMKAEIVARGVRAEKITVVPNGVSDEYFDERVASSAARRAAGLPAEGFWVGSVSSVVDYEGFDVLLRATAAAREAGADVRVLLAGDGAARPGLERLAEELGIASSVVFTGRVDGATARTYHRCLDVFCVPRIDAQVCRSVTPLKPIEALAVGTPVLMSDVPPLRELAEGAYGADVARALVSPGSVPELAEALTRAEAGDMIGRDRVEDGRRFARGRTWGQNAETITTIYRAMSNA